MLNRTLSIAITLAVAVAPLARGEEWGPWSASAEAPVITTAGEKSTPSPKTASVGTGSPATAPFFLLLRFYQRFISPLDGDRCPMYPTCSQYSLEAIKKHGPIIGIVLTADRLMHEADERHLTPAIKVGTRYRVLDPVGNNDFWWYGK